jgi:hypothetical protein
MKKLTKEQALKQEQKRIALIEKNAPLLFDIKNATQEGIKFKNQLDALNKKNADIVKTQKERCLSDFNKLQTFLGEYKDLVALYGKESESDGHFGFSIGGGVLDLIHVAYYFTREWWEDADNFETINGKNYPIYYPEHIDVFTDSVGETENYNSLEELFNDNNYTILIEKLLTEYIIKG